MRESAKKSRDFAIKFSEKTRYNLDVLSFRAKH